MAPASREDAPRPPSPPAVTRRTVLPAPQALGLLLVGVLPALALLGVFGPTAAELTRVEAGVEVHVTYPVRLRYRQTHALEVRIRNVSGRPVEALRVSFEPEYIGRFSRPAFTPAASEGYGVDLGPLPPGAERHVAVDVEGGAGGWYTGQVAVRGDLLAPIEIPLRTLVFP